MLSYQAAEFHKIFPLVSTILSSVQQIPDPKSDLTLLKAAVDATAQFLKWCSDEFIYDTGLVDSLLLCLRYPSLASSGLTGLSLVASLFSQDEALVKDSEGSAQMERLAFNVMGAVDEMVGCTGSSVESAYEAWRQTVDDSTVNSLASLLINRYLKRQHEYLLQFSLREDDAILKMCIDCYWVRLVEIVADDRVAGPSTFTGAELAALNSLTVTGREISLWDATDQFRDLLEKRAWMKPMLNGILLVAFERMVPPAEEQNVFAESDGDDGGRELLIESESLALHASIRDALVMLSHIAFYDTITAVQRQASELKGPLLDRPSINRVVYVIGALATRLLHTSILPESLISAIETDKSLGFPLPDDSAWFSNVVTTFESLLEICPSPDDKLYLDTQTIFLLGRFPKFLDENRVFLSLLMSKIFSILLDTSPVPASATNMATDTLEIVSYFNRTALCESIDIDGVSIIEHLLLEERPALAVKFSSNLVVLSSIYSSFGAAIRPLWWFREGPRLLEMLFSDINTEYRRWMNIVTSGGFEAIASSDAYQFFYKTFRLSIAVSGSLKGGFAPQMEHFEESLPVIYGVLSAYIAQAVEQGGIVVAGHSTIRWLRRVRKKVLLLAVVYGSGISIDSTADAKDTLPTFRPAIHRFGRITLPKLFDIVLTDWMASPPELREVEAMDIVDQSLNNLGGLIPREVLNKILEAIIGSVAAYLDAGDYHLYSEIRRSQFFILGFACSTRLLRIEELPADKQEQLIRIAVAGMKIFNRDVSKNALVMVYHFFGSYFPSIAVSTTFDRSKSPPKSSEFLATGIEVILDTVWEVMTDMQHLNTFENQAPVIARIFDIMSEAPRQVLREDQYEPGESNKGWLQRWFLRSLVKSFPQLALNPTTCEDLFQQLWSLPRRSTADEDAFGAALRDTFFDLAQFRVSDQSALSAKRTESPEEREEAVRRRIPSLALDSKVCL
ncbi:hypothetical protein P7C70_g3972, partial [Phenoliferia sp. Uapishka_3]